MFFSGLHSLCLRIAALGVMLMTFEAVMADIYVRGIVRDSVSTEGLPYASVRTTRGKASTVADSRGIFEFVVPEGSDSIVALCQGYAAKRVAIKNSTLQLYDIGLMPEATELAEVVIKKKKYSKRNNPAVEFVKRLKAHGVDNDPRKNDYYSYRLYERISTGINNFDTTATSLVMKKFPELSQHVDTSEISGVPVLNLSVKESAETIYFRREPRAQKRVVEGVKSAGIDEFVNQDNMQAVLSDLLREVNLYDSEIHLLRNDFVSPLSAIAPDFYRFYLVDSAAVVPGSDAKHIALAFYPRNKTLRGFQGHIYVPADDSTMTVRRVELSVSPEIDLNFVKTLRIEQSYDKAENGSQLKLSDNLFLEFEVVTGTPQLYVSRKINYSDHSFDCPSDSGAVFSRIGTVFSNDSAAVRDSTFWASVRNMPIPEGESRVDLLMTRLRKAKWFYWGEKFLRNMFSGYWATGSKSKFDIGPLNTTISYNSLEGLRLRGGGMTTANLSKHWFGRGYVAYGFRDHRWKYGVEAEYSFNAKKYHSREFPIHSLRFTHKYDIDRLGAHYLYTNADNFVLSLARMSDNRFTYRRDTRLDYTLELQNNLSLVLSCGQVWQRATPFVPFVDGNGRSFGHMGMGVAEIKLRYAPGEKFYQAASYRLPIDETVPVFEISHRWAPRFVGSDFGLNRTEIGVSKLFGLSFAGALDVKLSAGHVWGQTVFTELFIPNANLSYTIQPGSFALMNPMEFVNSSYVSWHMSYEMRGALISLVPVLRRTGIRGVVGFSGIYGHLSRRNTPGSANPELFAFPAEAAQMQMNKPYMELSAGLDNIFHILRLDYVWRLNYLDVPYAIDRRGLRVALHFTF